MGAKLKHETFYKGLPYGEVIQPSGTVTRLATDYYCTDRRIDSRHRNKNGILVFPDYACEDCGKKTRYMFIICSITRDGAAVCQNCVGVEFLSSKYPVGRKATNSESRTFLALLAQLIGRR